MSTNLYDFNDLSDLPEDLSKRLSTSAIANPNVAVYAGIISAAAEAGLKIMSISQVMAVAHRMGLTEKSQQTIRIALNSGVKAGLLLKPTRQTYAAAEMATQDDGDSMPDDVLDAGGPNSKVPPDLQVVPMASPADAQIDPLA